MSGTIFDLMRANKWYSLNCVFMCVCIYITLNSTLCSYLLDGKLQWEEEAHVDRDNSNEVIWGLNSLCNNTKSSSLPKFCSDATKPSDESALMCDILCLCLFCHCSVCCVWEFLRTATSPSVVLCQSVSTFPTGRGKEAALTASSISPVSVQSNLIHLQAPSLSMYIHVDLYICKNLIIFT